MAYMVAGDAISDGDVNEFDKKFIELVESFGWKGDLMIGPMKYDVSPFDEESP